MTRKINPNIPYGIYCYDKNGICPHWSSLDNFPSQENGYCSFLRKSDWDLNEEEGKIEWTNSHGMITKITQPHEIGISLLWDQVKMCSENLEEEEYDEDMDEDIKG